MRTNRCWITRHAVPPRSGLLHTAAPLDPEPKTRVRLSVETGPLAGTQLPLDRERPATLGSAESCTLRIQATGVLPEHAVVKALKDQGFGVKAHAAGLRVNGREVETTALQDGDVIELGTTRITYSEASTATVALSGAPQIAGFKILSELGRGGMGIVYRAEQVSLHRHVALKVLDQRLTRDPQFVARFLAEARAAAKLQHPNVVAVFNVEQNGGTYYYAMELMQGSLESFLKQNGKMPSERALTVIAEAASGLAYAESLRIVHRDIKPDNLMIDQHDTVKIADLGLARSDDSSEEHHAGTPHFMAPEQVLRKTIDHRSDLYALGCTFYRLVTGRTPFRGQSVKDILRAQVKDTAEPAHKVEPSVPAEVSTIIQKLMEKEPDNRYQSANELIDAVNLLLQPPAKKGLWIGLAATAVLIAGGALYYAVTKPKEFVEVEKRYDDPEKQQFADQIKVLKELADQDHATIKLLGVQLSGVTGEPLAAALTEIIKAHPGTSAAEQASALIKSAREAAAEQLAASAQKKLATDAAIATVAKQVNQKLAAMDPAAALAVTDKASAPTGVDEVAFAEGVKNQRSRVVTFATDRLQTLRNDLDKARSAHDLKAMDLVSDELQKILLKEGGWQNELLSDRKSIEAILATAQSSRSEHLTNTRIEQWQTLDALLHDPLCSTALAALDFARFAIAAQEIATKLSDAPAAAHAALLSAALQQAAIFADALAASLSTGKVPLSGLGDTARNVVGWQRDGAMLIVLDTTKKPAKEQPVPFNKITLDQWQALAAQVVGAPTGSRECFLAFLVISVQTQSARTWLGSLAKDRDDSGTGQGGYPISTERLDQAINSLPRSDAPWHAGVQKELVAARLLVGGLRALSERRNLAAAAQLEKLLADHAHSLAAALVP